MMKDNGDNVIIQPEENNYSSIKLKNNVLPSAHVVPKHHTMRNLMNIVDEGGIEVMKPQPQLSGSSEIERVQSQQDEMRFDNSFDSHDRNYEKD